MSSPKDVAGRYKVTSLNGSTLRVRTTVTLKLENSTTVSVHAKIANTMNGQWTLADGVYKGMLISTRMMGPPELMKVEDFLSEGGSVGLTLERKNRTLTLKYNNSTLVLTAE